MRRRSLNILLLAFTALWLGVLVPVHTRGVIRLSPCAGTSADAASVPGQHACCGVTTNPSNDEPAHETDGKRDCAVCYFVATLDLPPADEVNLSPAGLAEPLAGPCQQAPPVLDYPLPLHGRAPPTA